MLLDDVNDPEFVPEELVDNSVEPEPDNTEFVTEVSSEPIEDNEEDAYVPLEVCIAGPEEEIPETTDDCEEPTIFPPVAVAEDPEEIIEDNIELELVPTTVVPEDPKVLADSKEEATTPL
jgi:hypothetical protein